MSLWQNFITMAMMLVVFAIALVCAQSSDGRDRVLAYAVMIVYISIGAYHAYRLTKRT